MELELMFKNISLQEDENGHHLVIKQVGLYKEGKFIKNAKINKALVEQKPNGILISKVEIGRTRKEKPSTSTALRYGDMKPQGLT